MFTDSQPFGLFIKACEAKNACSNTLALLAKYEKERIIDVITVLCESAEIRIPYWIFRHMKDDINTAARQLLFKRITAVPVLALRLYLSEPQLTDYEERTLWNIIKKELPTAYREIEDGLITKRKATDI